MKLLLLLLFCHFSSSVKHSLEFLFTVSSEVPMFPDVVALVELDEVQVLYCDSNIKKFEPRKAWMKKLMDDGPQRLERYTQECVDHERFLGDQLTTVMQHLNQTEGVHVLQRRSGCEWDDETEAVNPVRRYGYDGEDFIELDMKTETWVALKPQAAITKRVWDNNKDDNSFWKNYDTNICPQWLKKYLDYGRSSLQVPEFPKVSLLQKSPSGPISCHATGFYPDRAAMVWRKDGKEIHEEVEDGDILRNNDGTYQMSVNLDISSVSPEDLGRYDCVFHLSGVNDTTVVKPDKTVIRTNWGFVSEFPLGPVIGGVVGFLLLAVVVAGVMRWRQSHKSVYRV